MSVRAAAVSEIPLQSPYLPSPSPPPTAHCAPPAANQPAVPPDHSTNDGTFSLPLTQQPTCWHRCFPPPFVSFSCIECVGRLMSWRTRRSSAPFGDLTRHLCRHLNTVQLPCLVKERVSPRKYGSGPGYAVAPRQHPASALTGLPQSVPLRPRIIMIR
jgi:hypothetical protein